MHRKKQEFFKNGRIYHVKRSSCKGIEKQYVRYSRSSQKKAETNGWAKKNTAAVMVQSRMGSFPLGEAAAGRTFAACFAKKYPIACKVREDIVDIGCAQGEKLRKLNEKCDAEGKQERAAEGLAGIPEQGEK